MTRRGRGAGGLRPGDRALWDEIKKTIKPLRLPADKPDVAGQHEPSPAIGTPQKPPKPPNLQPAPKASARRSPPLASLDRRTRQRVARGRIEIDGRLDLHGLTLARARTRLQTFLAAQQACGANLVLVITGKGGGLDGERGALRRQVPLWLALPEFRPLVIGFEEAAPVHGGAGALYVRIRRSRA